MKTQKTIADVGRILEDHIIDSVNRKTNALDQREPKSIAKTLKLKERLKFGFKSSEDILDFVTNFLYIGCIILLSTKTVIVLSALSLVTFPINILFGI